MTRSKSNLSPSFAWLLLLALGASQPALALQVVDARDGDTVLAKVSRKMKMETKPRCRQD